MPVAVFRHGHARFAAAAAGRSSRPQGAGVAGVPLHVLHTPVQAGQSQVVQCGSGMPTAHSFPLALTLSCWTLMFELEQLHLLVLLLLLLLLLPLLAGLAHKGSMA